MKTIVVVDDEFGLVDVVAMVLSDAGYRVFTASNGVQGLETMRENPPSLVLLDYMMPLMDGAEVLEAMRADARLGAVPVICMSSLPESTVSQRCQGYRAFLRKPFDFDKLIAAVRSALGAPDV